MTKTRYVYPARLLRDEDGRVLVDFPDFEFAVTDGADLDEALIQASDCLEENIAYYINQDEPIPTPSQFPRAQSLWMAQVAPGPVIAAKAALYAAVRAAGITKVALAARLGMNEKDVRRMLDPRHTTKIATLERALAALGKRLEITVSDIPTPTVEPARERA